MLLLGIAVGLEVSHYGAEDIEIRDSLDKNKNTDNIRVN